MVSEGEPVFLADLWKARQQAAQTYLDSVSQRPEWRELKTHRIVENAPAAEAIVDHARKHAVDVIVMATHGRSGFRRWVFGSVAEKVLRGADRPVLMVRAHAATDFA
jgi:nucleotide-binding universal stress UspA family protein